MRPSGGGSSKGMLLVLASEHGSKSNEVMTLTEPKKLLPIHAPPMVIENSTAGVWPVLPRPDCHAARLRPPTLNALPVHATGTLCIVDVISDLTAFSMAGQVELRNDDPPVTEGVEVEGRRDRVLGNP